MVANIRGFVTGGAKSLKGSDGYGGAEDLSQGRIIGKSAHVGNRQRASIEKLLTRGNFAAHCIGAVFPRGIGGEGRGVEGITVGIGAQRIVSAGIVATKFRLQIAMAKEQNSCAASVCRWPSKTAANIDSVRLN